MATTTKPVSKPATLTFPPYTNKRDTRQLLPEVQASLIQVLRECQRRGIFIFIIQAYRSAKEQHEAFLSGASKLDSGSSMHEFRVAVDIGCKGKDLYNRKTLEAAASVFRSFGWLWGDDWDNDGKSTDEKFHDATHFQFVTIAEQKIIYKLKTPVAINNYIKGRKKK